MNRTAYVLYRLVGTIPTLFGVLVLIFVLSRSIEGDPAHMMAGEMADERVLIQIRQDFKLDQPLWAQFWAYLENLMRGNMGISYQTKQPVISSLMTRFPATLELTLASFVFACMGAIPLGIISAVWRNRPIDHIVRVLSVGGVSMPVFWSGLMLLWLLYLQLGVLPGGGRIGVYSSPPPHITGMYTFDSLVTGNWALLRESLHHLFLPAFILGYGYMATLARLVRSSMLEVLTQDYVRTARAKGLTESRVIINHGLRNALIPVVTLGGLAFATLLGGAVITESIFSWPGVGKFVVDATLFLDYPVIMGFTLLMAVVYLVINFIVDLLYTHLNPQIQ